MSERNEPLHLEWHNKGNESQLSALEIIFPTFSQLELHIDDDLRFVNEPLVYDFDIEALITTSDQVRKRRELYPAHFERNSMVVDNLKDFDGENVFLAEQIMAEPEIEHVFILGEPGGGKTTILSQLIEKLEKGFTQEGIPFHYTVVQFDKILAAMEAVIGSREGWGRAEWRELNKLFYQVAKKAHTVGHPGRKMHFVEAPAIMGPDFEKAVDIGRYQFRPRNRAVTAVRCLSEEFSSQPQKCLFRYILPDRDTQKLSGKVRRRVSEWKLYKTQTGNRPMPVNRLLAQEFNIIAVDYDESETSDEELTRVINMTANEEAMHRIHIEISEAGVSVVEKAGIRFEDLPRPFFVKSPWKTRKGLSRPQVNNYLLKYNYYFLFAEYMGFPHPKECVLFSPRYEREKIYWYQRNF